MRGNSFKLYVLHKKIGYFWWMTGNASDGHSIPNFAAGDPCTQPMNPGQGFYQLSRWFWDASAGCCRPFVYRGQKGNQNNFLSSEDCARVCYGAHFTVNNEYHHNFSTTQSLPSPHPTASPTMSARTRSMRKSVRFVLPCGYVIQLFFFHRINFVKGADQETTVCCPAGSQYRKSQ